MKTQNERDYHAWIATLPCAACGDMPVHVHHIRHFAKRDSNNFLVIPLCPSCHQGNGGVHLAPKVFEMRNPGGEMKMLTNVIEQLWERR